MILTGTYPGVGVAEVRAGVGWSLRSAAALGTVEPPTAEELRILREVLDPQRFFLKG